MPPLRRGAGGAGLNRAHAKLERGPGCDELAYGQGGPTAPRVLNLLFEADDFTVERPMKVRIIRSPFAAVPLPPEIFSDASDEEIK